MEIKCSNHFLERQALRKFSDSLPNEVFFTAEEYYHDSITDTYVAVKKVPYHGTERDMALIYRFTDAQDVIFITMHPLKEGQKERRVQSKRWVLYDPEGSL